MQPKKQKKRGIFITLEGGEGAGKSSLIKRLAEKFQAMGKEVVTTREPGGTECADRIRSLLIDSSMQQIVPLAELLLYEASRAQHVSEKIMPALQRGAIVLCDRFTDSSLMYQGMGRKIDFQLVRKLNMIATQGLKPDLTFILDVDPRIGLRRIAVRGDLDRIEKEDISFHQAVRKGYRKLAKAEPRRCLLIDASKDKDSVMAAIDRILRKKKQL